MAAKTNFRVPASAKLNLAAGLFALVGLALMPAVASAARLSWSTPHVIDPPQFEFSEVDITDIACPSSSLCVAVDTNGTSGHILTSTTPADGTASWPVADMGEFQYPRAVSCPSPSFCAVADDRGNVLIATEPTGEIAAWMKVPLDTEAVEHETSFGFVDVSCPSASFCAAIDSIGNVFTSTDPTGGPEAWTKTELGDSKLDAISCASVSLCVITDWEGNIVTSSEPTGEPTAWHSTAIDASGLGGVSCPSTSRCLIGGFFGDMFTSANPTGGTGEWWRLWGVDGSAYLLSVSCPTTTFCVSVDSYDGHAVVSNFLADEVIEWTVTHLEGPEGLFAVSCASPTFCAAAGTSGSVAIGTEAEGGEEGGGGSEEEGGPSDGSGQSNPPASGSSSPAPSPSPIPGPQPHKKPLKCRKGFKKRKVHGKVKCVKVKKHQHQ